MEGYRIEQFEKAKPEAAEFDMVVYKATRGQRVLRVHGSIRVCGKSKRVIWDDQGHCKSIAEQEDLPFWDLKLEEGGGES